MRTAAGQTGPRPPSVVVAPSQAGLRAQAAPTLQGAMRNTPHTLGDEEVRLGFITFSY